MKALGLLKRLGDGLVSRVVHSQAEQKAREEAKLAKGLCAQLIRYAGEHGDSEGADECLGRLLGELNRYRHHLGYELRQWVNDGLEPRAVFNWTPYTVKRLLDDVERLRGVCLEVAGQLALERTPASAAPEDAAHQQQRTADLLANLCRRYGVGPFPHGDLPQGAPDEAARLQKSMELLERRGQELERHVNALERSLATERQARAVAEKEACFQKDTREANAKVYCEVAAEHEEEIAKLRADVEKERAAKNDAYTQRNELAALVARMVRASCRDWAGIRQHDPSDTTWEPDWRTILLVNLPTGQCSWHFHDSERHLLAGLPEYEQPWDGHTTEQKRERVRLAFAGGVVQMASPPSQPDPHKSTCMYGKHDAFANRPGGCTCGAIKGPAIGHVTVGA